MGVPATINNSAFLASRRVMEEVAALYWNVIAANAQVVWFAPIISALPASRHVMT
jgi:hypothetical protein